MSEEKPKLKSVAQMFGEAGMKLEKVGTFVMRVTTMETAGKGRSSGNILSIREFDFAAGLIETRVGGNHVSTTPFASINSSALTNFQIAFSDIGGHPNPDNYLREAQARPASNQDTPAGGTDETQDHGRGIPRKDRRWR